MGQASSTAVALTELNANISTGFQKVHLRFDEQSLKLGFLVEHASRNKAEQVLGSSEAAQPISWTTAKQVLGHVLSNCDALEQRAVLRNVRIECISHIGHLYEAVACFLRSIAVYVKTRSKATFDETAATPANLQNITKALRELKSSLDSLSIHPAQVAAGLKSIQKLLAVIDGALSEQKQWWRRPLQGYIMFFSHFGRLCVESEDMLDWQKVLWEPSLQSLQFPEGGDVWFMVMAFKTTRTFICSLDLDHQGRLVHNGRTILEFGESKSDISSRTTAIERAKKVAKIVSYIYYLKEHRTDLHLVNHLFVPKVHPSMQPESDLTYGKLTLKTHIFS